MALADEHSWEKIAQVEWELSLMLSSSCEKWFPVGSFRRKKETCHDLDMVVLPKYEERQSNLFGGRKPVSLFNEALERFGFEVSGKEAKKVIKYQGVQVDFYIATLQNFVMLGFIRTGSAENNVRLATIAKRKGMKLSYADGCIYQPGGGQVWIESEEQIYETLGQPWQEPEER